MFVTFYDDDSDSQRFPWVNTALLVVNIWVFLKTATRPDFNLILRDYGFLSVRPLSLGALTGPFLHLSWTQLVANMAFLFAFGRAVEHRLGAKNYLLAYLFCGLASEAVHWHFNPTSTIPLVGASRVVTGLGIIFLLSNPWGKMKWFISFFGAPIAEFPSRTLFVFALWAGLLVALACIPMAQVKTAATWLNVPLLATSGSAGIAWWAHAGAAAMGALLFFLMPKRKGVKRKGS